MAAITLTCAVATLPALSGCQKPLFVEEAPRTQFELHDRMRNRYRPTEEPDVFGRPQPALRSRLSPANR